MNMNVENSILVYCFTLQIQLEIIVVFLLFRCKLEIAKFELLSKLKTTYETSLLLQHGGVAREERGALAPPKFCHCLF